MRKHLLVFLMALLTTASAVFAQGNRVVTGKLFDAQTKEPLIGATVSLKGTTKATSVALDGSFKISVPETDVTLVLSYVGYVSKEVPVTGTKLGDIYLNATSNAMKEVNVTANPSLKINRQTPVAASSINQTYIEEKGAGAEFPELMRMTPGVTVSRGGGGYGDSRINIRGFSSNNVALLINGIPMNDVEAGKIYWNDWAGLEDVTTSMQIQRGLSASTVAVPSMGGSIDISTRATETKEGGTVSQSVGSYGQEKTLVSYATGLKPNGWAASFLLSRTTGNSPSSEGLSYTGYNYFANISKVINDHSTLSFSFMGAAQNHNQLYTYNYISTFKNAPQGTRYDSDWGYYNGQQFGAEQNYYNKPLASLNYNWKINESTSWSTVAYGTWGTGAADYLAAKSGYNSSLLPGSSTAVARTGGIYSPIDFNALEKSNLSNADGSANYYMQDVVNNHQQYGIISSIKKKVGDITYLAGVDLRQYRGEHFDKVDNLFGASYLLDTRASTGSNVTTGNINNPVNHAGVGDKFYRDYTYDVASAGVYAQAEYSKDDFTAFLTLSGNDTRNQRIDYFNYLNSDPNQNSKWLNFWGYQAKAGANYNLDEHNNVYANVGYIQRAPLVGSLWLNNNNTTNNNAIPEKLFDYELGYGYQSAMFTANLNAYRTTYRDRSEIYTTTDPNNAGSLLYANISGLNEVHQGIEADAKFRPIQGVVIGGMLSVGDYHYLTNTGAAQITSEDGTVLSNIKSLQVKGLKIGDSGSSVTGSPSATSAQTTAGGTIDIKVLSQFTIGGEYLYYSHYYAAYNPAKITFADYTPYQVPDFGTFNLNAIVRFKFAGLDAAIIGNVYNVFNTRYISDAYESSPVAGLGYVARTVGTATSSPTIGVDMGAPRFYVTTFKLKF